MWKLIAEIATKSFLVCKSLQRGIYFPVMEFISTRESTSASLTAYRRKKCEKMSSEINLGY